MVNEILDSLPTHRRTAHDETAAFSDLSERIQHMKIVIDSKQALERLMFGWWTYIETKCWNGIKKLEVMVEQHPKNHTFLKTLTSLWGWF